MTQPTASEAPGWYEFVLNFDETKKAFDDNYDALIALGPEINRYPGLWPQYDALVNEGATHRAKLAELQTTRDYIAGWLNWLQSGAVGAFNWLGRQVGLQGLDIAPVYIIASLGAASLALYQIGQWLANAYTMAQRWNAFLEMKRTGATDAQAAAQVNQIMGDPPATGFLGIPWALLAYATIAVFLGPPLLKAITGDRK